MQKIFRFLCFCSAFFIAYFSYSPVTFAQEKSRSNCEDCYNRGYDDGYDDAYDECPCPSLVNISDLGRMYLALAVGFNSFLFQRNVNFENETLYRLRAGANAALINVMLGYTLLWYNNLFLAAEVFLGTSSASSSNSSNLGTYDSKVSVNNSYGLALLPGIRYLNMLYFLRLGLIRTQFTVKDNITGLFNSSVSENANGVSYGLGVEMNVYKNFDLRLEANRINYKSFNSPIGSDNSFYDTQGIVTGVYRFAF